MSIGLNRVELLGHLGKTPTIKDLNRDGKEAVGRKQAVLSLATNESYRDAQGQLHRKTEWHRVVAFGALAEFATKRLGKGDLVFVEGSLRSRSWEDKPGGGGEGHDSEAGREAATAGEEDQGSGKGRPERRFITEVVARSIQLVHRSVRNGRAEDAGGGDQ